MSVIVYLFVSVSVTVFIFKVSVNVFRQELVGTDVKITHVQPGGVNTTMSESAAAYYNLDMKAVTHKMLVPKDIGEVVWEAVSRPARSYQVEVFLNDTLGRF